jgi:PAS domain S-box-containing protein
MALSGERNSPPVTALAIGAERAAVVEQLDGDRIRVDPAPTVAAALDALVDPKTEHAPDCVVVSHLADGSVPSLRERVREHDPALPVLVWPGTATGDGDTDGRTTVTLPPELGATALRERVVGAASAYRAARRLREVKPAVAVARRARAALLDSEGERAAAAAVCETFATAQCYRLAWVGVRDGDRVRPLAAAGAGVDSERLSPVDPGDTPVGSALDGGTYAADRCVAPAPERLPWPGSELDGDPPSAVAAVPVEKGRIEDGVLAVYADRPDGFDPVERKILWDLAASLGREIDAARRYEEAAADSRLLDTIFDSIPAHLFVKDTERRHLRVSNHYADRDSWSQTRAETIGKTDEELYPEELARSSREQDRAVIEDGEEIIHEEENLGVDGKWNLTSKVPWYGEDGEVRGLIGIAQRITERKRYERALQQQIERLEEFSRLLSHDLSSPLTVAKGRLDMARSERGDSEHLDGIENALDRIEEITEDAVTLAREGQHVEFEDTEEVTLEGIARESWENIATGDATLAVEADMPLRATPDRLARVFENLFRNAVEHGPASDRAGAEDSPAASSETDCAVTVSVGALADGCGFYVADDGTGIPPEDRERVFDRGFSASEGGTGLGLRIVEQLVAAHGWDVRAIESESGGARFEVTGVDSPHT